MIKCGKCGESHTSVAEVRACYAKAAAAPQNPQPVTPEWALYPATPRQRELITKLDGEKDTAKLPTEQVDTWMNFVDGKTIGKREASALIDAMIKLPSKDGAAAKPREVPPDVPAGRYALVGDDGVVRFYKVDRPTEGKWSGYVFVKMLVGGVGDWQEYPVKGGDRRMVVLRLIEKAGVRESAALFGMKAKHCGSCMSPLSQLQSRAAGYGAHCASKHGWFYPSKAEARVILAERGEDVSDDE